MSQKVTILDIAKELKITPGTVSRALNDNQRISSETIRRVKEKAKELKYQRNKIASSLRSGKSHTIGVIIPSAQMNFFGSVVHGIELMANSIGYGVLLFQTEETTTLEKKAIDTFLSARVDGILVSIAKETEDASHFKELQKRNIPLVFFDRTNDKLKAPSVVVDDYEGAFLATEHLIKRGYQRIAHVYGPQHIKSFVYRLEGYREALKKHGFGFDEKLIYPGNISIESGKEAIDYFLGLKNVPDAVFAVEDYTALGVIKGLKERKINIQGQFGVIGFANENFGEHITPSLSTVDQQTVQMGKDALELLVNLMDSTERKTVTKTQRKVILKPILIIRESTTRKSNND